MFYLANTLGIAFYLQGFTDTVADLAGFDTNPHAYWIKVGKMTAARPALGRPLLWATSTKVSFFCSMLR